LHRISNRPSSSHKCKKRSEISTPVLSRISVRERWISYTTCRSHGCNCEDGCLLGCNAVQRNSYQCTWHYNPEDSHLPVHFFPSIRSSIRCIFTSHGTYLLNSPIHCHTPFIPEIFSITNGSVTELIFCSYRLGNQSSQLIHCLVKSFFSSLKTFYESDQWNRELLTRRTARLQIRTSRCHYNCSTIPTFIRRFGRSITQLFKCSSYSVDVKLLSLQQPLSSVQYHNGASL
jgi:hypothetical protein